MIVRRENPSDHEPQQRVRPFARQTLAQIDVVLFQFHAEQHFLPGPSKVEHTVPFTQEVRMIPEEIWQIPPQEIVGLYPVFQAHDG